MRIRISPSSPAPVTPELGVDGEESKLLPGVLHVSLWAENHLGRGKTLWKGDKILRGENVLHGDETLCRDETLRSSVGGAGAPGGNGMGLMMQNTIVL